MFKHIELAASDLCVAMQEKPISFTENDPQYYHYASMDCPGWVFTASGDEQKS